MANMYIYEQYSGYLKDQRGLFEGLIRCHGFEFKGSRVQISVGAPAVLSTFPLIKALP